jgi:hypothetical protein
MDLQADSINKRAFGYSAILFIMLLFVAMQIGCRSALKLESNWRSRDLSIDGKSDDWIGVKYYFEDVSVSVGLINDDRHLYVSMITENRLVIGQIMMQGLTLWLDPKGGKEKTFGIKFPLGRQEARKKGGEPMPPESMEMRNQENMTGRLQEALTKLAVIGPEGEVVEKLPVDDAKGIDVKLRVDAGLLTYEIKIPLSRSEEHPYAVGAKVGETIGLGLESPKLTMEIPDGMRGGGMRGGGMGGGPPGGVAGIRSGGMGFQMPEKLKIWAAVKLASGTEDHKKL